MTRPPEYDQVALWLRALTGDPALAGEIKASYPGPGQIPDAGLTRAEYAEQECQRLAAEASRELFSVWFDGIDPHSRNLDQVAEAYHRDQVAECAHSQRGLQEKIRQLEDGDFEVPSWSADQAAQSGTGLELAIAEHRAAAILDARARLAALPGAYKVTDDEVHAYWAARHHTAAQHLIDKHRAEPGLVARDAPTLRLLDGIHYAAHESLDRGYGTEGDPHDNRYHPPWGQLAIQAQAGDWWEKRDRLYTHRPEVLDEIRQLRTEASEQAAAKAAYLEHLEHRAEEGSPRAQQRLNEEMARQALETDPPEPSAKEDPGEWRDFFREVLGRDMPQNAAHEAESYRIDAAAPPDVGGMAAAYYEVNYPRGYDDGELEEEREGLSWEQLYRKRYEELQASGAAAGTPKALASRDFPADLSKGVLGPLGAAAPRPATSKPSWPARGRTP